MCCSASHRRIARAIICTLHSTLQHTVCYSVLQFVAVCCSASHRRIARAIICRQCRHHYSNGILQHIECLKLQVIFRKRATNYRALLQNLSYTDKALYDSTPPCSSFQDTDIHKHTHTLTISMSRYQHIQTHVHKHTTHTHLV